MNTQYRDQILDWIEKRLEGSSEFFLPLKLLWRQLKAGVKFSPPPLEEIRGWLQADDRFDLMDAPSDLGGSPGKGEEEMESLGFFKGPRVGLKAKRPSQKEIADKLEEHLNNLTRALQKAYAERETAGESIPGLEDQLLELMKKVQKFKNTLPLEEEEDTEENQKAE